MVNDLASVVALARRRGILVCADCVSSLGAVPLDLRGVAMATGVSGKSLGAYAGVAMVFIDLEFLPRLRSDRLPAYMDLKAAVATAGPRFTFPSPLLRGLHQALKNYATPAARLARFQEYEELGNWVRCRLRRLGIEPLVPEPRASPVITTFAPPGGEASERFVARSRSWGYEVSGLSHYLEERRWVQVATMGEVRRENLLAFWERLARCVSWYAALRQPAPV
jgi:aspartate aminotransferase-like enzyme